MWNSFSAWPPLQHTHKKKRLICSKCKILVLLLWLLFTPQHGECTLYSCVRTCVRLGGRIGRRYSPECVCECVSKEVMCYRLVCYILCCMFAHFLRLPGGRRVEISCVFIVLAISYGRRSVGRLVGRSIGVCVLTIRISHLDIATLGRSKNPQRRALGLVFKHRPYGRTTCVTYIEHASFCVLLLVLQLRNSLIERRSIKTNTHTHTQCVRVLSTDKCSSSSSSSTRTLKVKLILAVPRSCLSPRRWCACVCVCTNT